MSVFAVNQNRHFYVATQTAENLATKENPEKGEIEMKIIGDGKGLEKELFILYKGADTVLKSDRIQLKNLDYVKAVKKEDMRIPFKSIKVELSDDLSELVVGQDYVLRIVLRQFYGKSDSDQYFKDGAVHCTKAMKEDPSKFWEAMAEALNLAFAREIGASKTQNPYLTFEAAADSLTITEKEQDWTLGIGSVQRVLFEVVPTTVFTYGDDVMWNKVTNVTVAKEDVEVGVSGMGNGKMMADLEWFCMGERGDQYRMAGYPNYVPTKYLVDEEEEYNALELHFAFTDTGVNSYRSEKDITIVSTETGVINDLIGVIKEHLDAVTDIETL